jgi:GalNAc-alpha-(1->4)-GalNAc-alpha-(1->3)-diNAcBac-PP-undecaprenol alpha-1,4-N-acetyl-D-galactosaminyltransferase
MRITFVISSLGGGGAERSLTTLANHWVEHGWSVMIITLTEAEQAPFYKLHPAVDRSGLDMMSESDGPLAAMISNLRRIWALHQNIRSSNPQIVVSFMDMTNILTLLATRGLGLPVVVSERTNPARHVVQQPWKMLRQWVYPWADRLTMQFSGAEKLFPDRMRDSIRVIPNAVIAPPPETGFQPLLPGRYNLAAIGRLETTKGFDLLLAAFAQLVPSFPEWGLVILGEGPQRSELHAQIVDLDLTGRVLFTGQVNNPHDYFRAADLFVLSSRYEGFPNAICEAMSVGLPIVATRASGGVESIVRDGVDGLLIPVENITALAEALNFLMGDRLRREEMGKQAVAITERFDFQAVVALWENMLTELV